MIKLNNINIDLTNLTNLLEDVVAYVEVRKGDEDISNIIAREMKELGATISENRNPKVTHVIFSNGTLRTSNWAKKHEIPLVDLGWLAACTKHKFNLLSRPWHVNYLVEPVDKYGSKIKMKYKKYFKNMNVEEYEAELARHKERRKKRIEKSVNNSKSDGSFDSLRYDSPEHERIMKRSDPMRKLPTPEIVKRYEARLNKFKLTGRYSWESDNSNNELENNDSILPVESVEIPSKINDETIAMHSIIPCSSTPRKFLKSRRLLREINELNDSLIEPVHNINHNKEYKNILPPAVQKGLNGPVATSKKRSSGFLGNNKLSKKQCLSIDFSDIILPKKKLSINTNAQLTSTPISNKKPINSPKKSIVQPISTNHSPNKLPLSPLITQKSTTITDIFTTPKATKRKSLRTRMLKRSAKKQYQQILAPNTEKIERHQTMKCPIELFETILGTPTNSESSINNANSKPENPFVDSMQSILFDTPNISRHLDKIIPNRQKPQSYDHILFIPKETYDHYSRAIAPNFLKQKNYISKQFVRPSKELMDNLFNEVSSNQPILNEKSSKHRKFARVGIRKSARLSGKFIITNTSNNDQMNENIINMPSPIIHSNSQSTNQYSENNKNINCQSTNSPISIFQSQTIDGKTSDICKSLNYFSENDTPTIIDPLNHCKQIVHSSKESMTNLSNQNAFVKSISNEESSKTRKLTRFGIRKSARLSSNRMNENIINMPSPIINSNSQSTNQYSENNKNINHQSTNSPISIFQSQTIDGTTSDICKSSNQLQENESQLITDPLDIFKPDQTDSDIIHKPNNRRSIRLATTPAKPLSTLIVESSKMKNTNDNSTTKNILTTKLKRPWSKVDNGKTNIDKKPKIIERPIKKIKNRNSNDDYIFNPPSLLNKRIAKTKISTEIVLVGFSNEEQNNIKSICSKLLNIYHFGDIIRAKEQIVVVPENPKKTVEIIKAFVFGNTFVSINWIRESVNNNKWLNSSSFIIKDIEMIDLKIFPTMDIGLIFKNYSSMYISSTSNGIHKYKLRIIIEMAGGKVTNSFRQAGIVINTRKINALSIKESWILDSVRDGKVLDTKKYLLQ